MSVYVGLGDSSKEISGIFLGAEESVKEISDAYIGNADGSLQQMYTSYVAEPGQQVFTSSGTFTVPKGVKSVDVFLVGGGGAGGNYNGTFEARYGSGGIGGGGGYTKTVKGISVIPNKLYDVIIGSGASINTDIGGTSSAFGYESAGGYTGKIESDTSSNKGCGGSGGGGAADKGRAAGGNGGSDGSNGWTWYGYTGQRDKNSVLYTSGGICIGQGTTTRAFGESSGALYAGGGGGGSGYASTVPKYGWGGNLSSGGSGGGGYGGGFYYNYDWMSNFSYRNSWMGTSGTGGGGGGGYYGADYNDSGNLNAFYKGDGSSGGSGCVIIRWGY